jgi:hypothetical protein
MRRILAALVVLGMLIMPSVGLSEGTKKVCVGTANICVALPEKAPDFNKFDANVLGSKRFENGNAVQVLELMNEDATVDVIVLVVMLEEKVSIVALQVSYAPEGFAKFDAKKTHVTDQYEDVGFTKQGKPTGLLIPVQKLSDYDEFSKFLEGRKI